MSKRDPRPIDVPAESRGQIDLTETLNKAPTLSKPELKKLATKANNRFLKLLDIIDINSDRRIFFEAYRLHLLQAKAELEAGVASTDLLCKKHQRLETLLDKLVNHSFKWTQTELELRKLLMYEEKISQLIARVKELESAVAGPGQRD